MSVLQYEKDYYINIHNHKNEYYYFFDWGERFFNINMEFQHMHSFYEIYILMAPKAQHMIAGVLYDIAEGDMVLLSPSTLHKSIYPRGLPSRRLVINFALPESLFNMPEAYLPLLDVFNIAVPIFRFERSIRHRLFYRLNELFILTRSPSYQGEETDQLMVHMKFMEFLYDLRGVRELNMYSAQHERPLQDRKIYEITAHIHSHFDEELGLSKLASQFDLSPSYLSHQFKKVTGVTLTRYVQMTRIKNVQFLLQTTDKAITQIALDSGFMSFSQFNRIFRQESGMSPSAYRSTHSMWKVGKGSRK